MKFYSHGKVLLTAEYAVLEGVKALSLPTKKGQSLTVEYNRIRPLNGKVIQMKTNCGSI